MNTWTFSERKWGNKKINKRRKKGKVHVTLNVANGNAQRLIRKHARTNFNIM
jgi:hypothetical protein